MASFNYTTVEGDRIDLLAAKFYGSMDGIAIISDANPLVPLTAVFRWHGAGDPDRRGQRDERKYRPAAMEALEKVIAKITVNGKNVTADVSPYLSRLSYADKRRRKATI